MDQVGALVPVLPVPLVATVLLQAPAGGLSDLEIKAAAAALVQRLQTVGAHLYLPRSDWDYAIGAGLRMLNQRHLVRQQDGLFSVAPGEAPLLAYYANSIAHLLEGGATMAAKASRTP